MARVVSGTLLPLLDWPTGAERARSDRRARFFLVEIGISLGFNIVLAGLATWWLSDWSAAGNGRFGDATFEMAMATIGPLVGFVIPVTLGTRRRVRRGRVAAMVGPRLLPRNVVLRLAALAAIALVVLGLPAAWLLAMLAPQGGAFLLFKLGYGAIVALTLTPVVLVAALCDR